MGTHTEAKAMPSMSDTITLVGGQFTQRVEEGTPHAEPRALTKGKNEGKEVWELHFPALSGMLMNAEITESNFGGQDGTITLKDFKTGESFQITVAADNGMFTNFIKCLPNIDPTKEVWLQMQPKKNGKCDTNGHPLTDLRVFQDDRIVTNFYQEYDKQERKYKTVNEMPEWENTPKGWNHDDQDYFLWEKCQEFFATYIAPTGDPSFGLEDEIHVKVTSQSVDPRYSSIAPQAGDKTPASPNDPEDEDIPF